MHSNFFCLLIVLLLQICKAKYQCANDTEIICDDKCMALVDMFHRENAISSWNHRHPHLAKVYRDHNIQSGVEIGVARGGLSSYLLTHVPSLLNHHGVDPFIGGYDVKDAMSEILKEANSSYHWSKAVQHNMKEFGCRFKLHYGFSIDAIGDFQPDTMDSVFIDGDHTYEGCLSDIKLWGPIVKNGGIIVFDDYGHYYPGVIKAVDQFCKLNKLSLEIVNKMGNVMVVKPSYPLNYDIENVIL